MTEIVWTQGPVRQTPAPVREVMLPAKADSWVPANGGTETVFTSRSGIRMLYCWQRSTGQHAYINVDTDMVMSNEEAQAALGMY